MSSTTTSAQSSLKTTSETPLAATSEQTSLAATSETPLAATSEQTSLAPPKRADARRNYEKVLKAAREAFAEDGEATTLEEIARRAGVGIGTLYRHFPTRQVLVETLYVDELEGVCRSAAELEGADPGEALDRWFERLIAYIATKQALAYELSKYLDPDARLFGVCRSSLFAAGEPLLKRAQAAGVVRADVNIAQVIQMVVGVSKIPVCEPGETRHLIRIALDGLRYRAGA